MFGRRMPAMSLYHGPTTSDPHSVKVFEELAAKEYIKCRFPDKDDTTSYRMRTLQQFIFAARSYINYAASMIATNATIDAKSAAFHQLIGMLELLIAKNFILCQDPKLAPTLSNGCFLPSAYHVVCNMIKTCPKFFLDAFTLRRV